MVQKYVTSDRLASLLLLDKVYEPTPLPFRMQSHVELLVGVVEYIDFCEWLQEPYALATETNDILDSISKYRLQLQEDLLFLYFAKDIAYAQIKELVYASQYGKGATKISMVFDGVEQQLDLSTYSDNWLEELKEAVGEMDEYLNFRNYHCTIRNLYDSGVNRYLLKRAVYTYQFSQLGVVAVFI